MAFPQSFMDELTARSDIVDVVGSYVQLTRKGSNLFGLCPFHSEKTGSFSVSPDKQIYYCFGCKKGGGVVNFIMDIENLPFPEYSFDAVICSNSFHHYPNPQAFFNSAYRILRKGGRLVLRDYTSSDLMVWLMNHLEMPLANLFGHGDVRIRKPAEFTAMAEKAGFTVLTMEKQKGFRAHLVARK